MCMYNWNFKTSAWVYFSCITPSRSHTHTHTHTQDYFSHQGYKLHHSELGKARKKVPERGPCLKCHCVNRTVGCVCVHVHLCKHTWAHSCLSTGAKAYPIQQVSRCCCRTNQHQKRTDLEIHPNHKLQYFLFILNLILTRGYFSIDFR